MNEAPILQVEPVKFEVIRSGLYAICEEMKSVIVRGAFSSALNLSADLSCALLDRDGNVIAQGNDIPVHLGAMTYTAKGIFAKIPPNEMEPGDSILTNDVYSGGTHLPDMTLLTPIFSKNNIIGFAASRVHWSDIGGSAAGSASVTDEIYKEGLQIPPIKLVEKGQFNESLLEVILANVRLATERLGDLKAQYSGNIRALTRIHELVEKYGYSTIQQVFQDVQNYSEYLIRNSLREIPDGEYFYKERLDGDGYKDSDDSNLICVKISKKDSNITFDFRGTAPCVKGPINAPIAVTSSSVYYVVRAICSKGIPVNSGCYRPIKIITEKGTLVHATHPASVVAANTETSNRMVDILLAALSKSIPEKVIAGSYGSGAVFTLGGWDTYRERNFIHYETVGGGMGASKYADGLNGIRVHMGNTMNIPSEAVESTLPVQVSRYELITGSGGTGKFIGGLGVRKVIKSLVNGIEVSLLGERTSTPAFGINGGDPGSTANFFIKDADDQVTKLSSKTISVVMNKGDELWIETAGGGGYGRDKS